MATPEATEQREKITLPSGREVEVERVEALIDMMAVWTAKEKTRDVILGLLKGFAEMTEQLKTLAYLKIDHNPPEWQDYAWETREGVQMLASAFLTTEGVEAFLSKEEQEYWITVLKLGA